MKKKIEETYKEDLYDFRSALSKIPKDWVGNVENRIKYTNSDKYSNVINSGLGSYYERFGGIGLDIVNNLPTIAYNYEYKCHVPISLVCYMIQPELAYQAVDTVLNQIQLKSGFPVDHDKLSDNEVIIFSKSQLIEEVFSRKHNILHIVYPKKDCSIYEESLNYERFNYYLNYVIRRYLYKRAKDFIFNAFKVILGGK